MRSNIPMAPLTIDRMVSIAATPKQMPATPMSARSRCRRRLTKTSARKRMGNCLFAGASLVATVPLPKLRASTLPRVMLRRLLPGRPGRDADQLEANLHLGIHLQHERDADDLQLPGAVIDGRLAGDGVDSVGLGEIDGKLDALGLAVESKPARHLALSVGGQRQITQFEPSLRRAAAEPCDHLGVAVGLAGLEVRELEGKGRALDFSRVVQIYLGIVVIN